MSILGGSSNGGILGDSTGLKRVFGALGFGMMDPQTRALFAQQQQMKQQQQAVQNFMASPQGEAFMQQNPQMAAMVQYGLVGPQDIASAMGYGGAEAPASVREWEHFSGLSPDEQRRYLEMKRSSQMMNLGDRFATRDPISNQAADVQGGQIQLGPNETPDYLANAGFAGQAGKEAAVNAALPERKAIESGAAINKARQEKGSENATALRVYETAMEGLMSGLQGSNTGAIVGRLPAVTAEQQIAEGAVSAMAPVLKSIFRVAGEGTFTDKDQETLLNMLPTRKDEPEAIQAKLQNVDAIVRAKLGQVGQPEEKQPSSKKRGVFNPQTGKIEWQ